MGDLQLLMSGQAARTDGNIKMAKRAMQKSSKNWSDLFKFFFCVFDHYVLSSFEFAMRTHTNEQAQSNTSLLGHWESCSRQPRFSLFATMKLRFGQQLTRRNSEFRWITLLKKPRLKIDQICVRSMHVRHS